MTEQGNVSGDLNSGDQSQHGRRELRRVICPLSPTGILWHMSTHIDGCGLGGLFVCFYFKKYQQR